jgi:hypothetical protein
MSQECRSHLGYKKYIHKFGRKMEGRFHLEDKGVDGRIILNGS